MANYVDPVEYYMRQQERRDNQIRGILSTFLAAKQNKQEEGWREKEYGLKERQVNASLGQQDIENARQEREVSMREPYYQALADDARNRADREPVKPNPPAKIAEFLHRKELFKDKKDEEILYNMDHPGFWSPQEYTKSILAQKAEEAKITAANRPAPKEDPVTAPWRKQRVSTDNKFDRMEAATDLQYQKDLAAAAYLGNTEAVEKAHRERLEKLADARGKEHAKTDKMFRMTPDAVNKMLGTGNVDSPPDVDPKTLKDGSLGEDPITGAKWIVKNGEWEKV